MESGVPKVMERQTAEGSCHHIVPKLPQEGRDEPGCNSGCGSSWHCPVPPPSICTTPACVVCCSPGPCIPTGFPHPLPHVVGGWHTLECPRQCQPLLSCPIQWPDKHFLCSQGCPSLSHTPLSHQGGSGKDQSFRMLLSSSFPSSSA